MNNQRANGAAAAATKGLLSWTFAGLTLDHFCAVLNDNTFRWLVTPIGYHVLGQQYRSLILPVGLACVAVPYILLIAPAGYLADRFSKRTVVAGCMLFEAAVLAFGVAGILMSGVVMVFSALALIGAVGALMAPAIFGTVPETVREERISAANGVLGFANVLAAVCGSVLGNSLYVLTAPRGVHLWWVSGGILIAITAIGWGAAFLVEKRPPADPKRPFPKRVFAQSFRDLKFLAGRRDLFGAAAASAFLWFLAAMSQVNVYLFATTTLHISQAAVGPLLGVLAAGVAVGSIIAAVWSGHSVEVGLTPIGAGGIALACLIMFFTPRVAAAGSHLAYFCSCGGLLFMGMSAGLYDIPLRAYLQDYSRQETRGEILSAGNFLIFTAMLIAAGLFYVLTSLLGIGALAIFLIAGILTAAATIVILYYLHRQAAAALAKPLNPDYSQCVKLNGLRRGLSCCKKTTLNPARRPAMNIQSAWQLSLGFLGSKPICVEPVDDHLSTDAGLLPIRQLDEQLGLTADFIAALQDTRFAPAIEHTFAEMTRARIYGILAGYADQNDHDQLRYDAIFKLLAGRQLSDPALASQPTLSRFENAIDIASLNRLRDEFINKFMDSFDEPPRRLTFDIDTFDDPTHGDQQLTFFHGYYEQYQYQPRLITCAQNDLTVMVCLLHGTAHAALGADDDLEYLAKRLRAKWPDVIIELRGDSAMAVPTMYDACERLRIEYTLGLKLNSVLKTHSDALLAQAVAQYEQTGQPQRLFEGFWYQAGSWEHARWVVMKAEANAQGTNRRAVVTNRPGGPILPQATYDAYAERGESENRNKEIKCGIEADRLSDHRYLANLFRLYLHAAALNLLVRTRNRAADPPPQTADSDLPREALPQPARRQFFNHRRERDPLGEGQPNTWRMRLIKVAARVKQTTRRIVVQLSGSWPYLDHYWQVSQKILGTDAPSPDSG